MPTPAEAFAAYQRLNDSDLEGFARRIANHAREELEAQDKMWIYLPSFSKAVTNWALAILKSAVHHEQQQNAFTADDYAELYDALFNIVSIFDEAVDDGSLSCTDYTANEVLKAARAALAKAHILASDEDEKRPFAEEV